jgi:hypothetical protein
MNVRKGVVAGLGIASLLVALPAMGQSSTGSSSGSPDPSSSSGGSSGLGSGSTGSSSSPGSSSGSSGSMGSDSSSAGGTGSSASSDMSGKSHVMGTVDKFDQGTHQLSLQLKVDSTTRVMKNGQKASLSDIKEGDQVRASLDSTGQVQRIDIMSGGSSGSSGTSGRSTSPGSSGSSGSMGSSPGSSGSSGGSSGRGY